MGRPREAERDRPCRGPPGMEDDLWWGSMAPMPPGPPGPLPTGPTPMGSFIPMPPPAIPPALSILSIRSMPLGKSVVVPPTVNALVEMDCGTCLASPGPVV